MQDQRVLRRSAEVVSVDMFSVESVEERWSRLSLFMSRDILERRHRALHGLQISAGKANEIIAHLEQAQQYFKSSELAGVLAGPLEQYYGVLAVARAIVLFRKAEAREATLRKSHGLGAVLPGTGNIEDIALTISEGTFSELLDATKNSELVTVDEVAGLGPTGAQREFVVQLPRPGVGTVLSLVDLLSRIPSLRGHFESAMARPACCYGGRLFQWMNTLTLQLYREQFDLPDPEALRKALNISTQATVTVSPGSQPGVRFDMRAALGERLDKYLPYTIQSSMGSHTAVEYFSGRWGLSELAMYFAASHVLSMLVRYHPTVWAALVSHATGDQLLPVLQRMRGLVQSEFVQLGLWELERKL